MLVTIFIILLVLWILGVISNYTFGGLVHLLLVAALVVLVLSLAEGRGRFAVRLNRNLGMVLAGIWFILTGLFGLIAFSFQGQAIVMAVLALAAGVLLLLGR